MIKLSRRQLLAIGLLFSLLSSIRLHYLPEFEFLLLIILFIINDKYNFSIALVAILSSHHYAIPDEVFRFESANYPSIYTKEFLNLKILDLLTVLYFLYSIRRSGFIFNSTIRLYKLFPLVLFSFAIIGILTYTFNKQNTDLILFNFRSILLIISSILFFIDFEKNDLIKIAFLAIFTWLSKMFFSIIFPADYPLYREIFGVHWLIYFAGDEYLNLGNYIVSILLLSYRVVNKESKRIQLILKYVIFIGLLLTLISQRKGSIIYFSMIYLTLINHFRNKKIRLVNGLLFFSPLSTFIFLWLIVPILPELARIIFLDQLGLLNSSIESLGWIIQTDFFHFLFGIGPFSKYEIKGLEPIFDNNMAFGSEVGEQFRYMIWSLPYGRLILNVGFLGLVIYLYFILSKLKSPSSYFYLYSYVLPIFYLENTTPVSALATGFSFVVLHNFHMQKSRLKLVN